MSNMPRIQAHRGYSGRFPENTLLAFEQAIQAGAEQIELDIRAAKDGTVFVIHDATVDRTTNGTGAVADLTAEEVRALDAGAWFAPEFAGERVPLFTEVLDALKGRVRINIEIKVDGAPLSLVRHAIEQAIEALRSRSMLDQAFFSSFSLDALYWAKRTRPEVGIALLDWDLETHLDRQESVLALKGQGWLPHPKLATPERVRQAKARGLFTISGGGNDPQTRAVSVQRLVEAGVDWISTNFPAEVREVLEQLQAGPAGP